MPREIGPSLNEKQFFQKALQENVRIDGRSFDEFRGLELNFGDEYGVADVRLGKTRVLTQISATVIQPLPERPFDGVFTITTELSPMTSPVFEPGRPSAQEQLISRLLEKTIRRSQALDTESLCLIAGQKVWSVRADVHVLSHDGGLVDACSVAVIAALQHFRRPDTSTEGESVTVYSLSERTPVPLSLLHHPLCITFSFYFPSSITTASNPSKDSEPDEPLTLLDATHLEESLRDGSITIGMNRHGEVCQIAKLGGTPVDAVALLNCVSVAGAKVKEISAYVSKRLEEDGKRRNKGVEEMLSAENDRVS